MQTKKYKSYSKIKEEREKKMNKLIKDNGVFFAFSDKQLKEGKEKIGIKDNAELYNIGDGGFIAKSKVKNFMEEMEKMAKKHIKELKENKKIKEDAILYELENHESFYAGNIEPVFDLFEGIFSKDDIQNVFKKYYYTRQI